MMIPDRTVITALRVYVAVAVLALVFLAGLVAGCTSYERVPPGCHVWKQYGGSHSMTCVYALIWSNADSAVISPLRRRR